MTPLLRSIFTFFAVAFALSAFDPSPTDMHPVKVAGWFLAAFFAALVNI